LKRPGRLAGDSIITEVQADRSIHAVHAELGLALYETVEAKVAVRHDHHSDFGGATNPKLSLA
jgi:iron complex outermembrane receptor protein